MRLKSIIIISLLFVVTVGLDSSFGQTKGKVDNAASKDSAIVALAGEFRTVFANLLWIKAEHYHHEFESHNADWTKDADLLGMDRLVTKLDPHFEEAYAAAAVMLIANHKTKEARNLLEEGVTNNPNSMMLHDQFGTVLARHMKDYKASLFHLKRAYCLANNDWDRTRLKRLMKTVEEMSKTKSSCASSSHA